MKKALLFSLIVLILGLAGSAQALPKFKPCYLVVGQVAGIPAAPVAGRTIVFFKASSLSNTVSIYTAATLDAEGKFQLNAANHQELLPLKVGEVCKVAVVKDSQGYGAGPVGVKITGTGYDTTPVLTMALGSGVGLGEPVQAMEPAPSIKLQFNNRLYQISQDKDGNPLPFVVSERPRVSAQIKIDDPYTLAQDVTTYAITLDQGTSLQQTLSVNQSTAKKVLASGSLIDENKISALSLEYDLAQPLAEGQHVFALTAQSSGLSGGAKATITTLATVEVLGGPVRLIGVPITFPSPVSLTKDGNVTIQYQLSKDADIQIVFTSIAARVIKNFVRTKGQEGGTAGINKVTWDGRTDRGPLAGNGIYLGTIVSKEDGRKLGSVKLTIVD